MTFSAFTVETFPGFAPPEFFGTVTVGILLLRGWKCAIIRRLAAHWPCALGRDISRLVYNRLFQSASAAQPEDDSMDAKAFSTVSLAAVLLLTGCQSLQPPAHFTGQTYSGAFEVNTGGTVVPLPYDRNEKRRGYIESKKQWAAKWREAVGDGMAGELPPGEAP